MSLRIVLVTIGLLEVARPRAFVDFWMNLATKGDEDVELQSWVYTAARIEGILILAWVLLRRRGG